jgi:hypothetical protein
MEIDCNEKKKHGCKTWHSKLLRKHDTKCLEGLKTNGNRNGWSKTLMEI